MTERNNDEGRRTPRPKRKRPEDSRPESERRRKRPSETPSVTAADRRDSSLKEGAREGRSLLRHYVSPLPDEGRGKSCSCCSNYS